MDSPELTIIFCGECHNFPKFAPKALAQAEFQQLKEVGDFAVFRIDNTLCRVIRGQCMALCNGCVVSIGDHPKNVQSTEEYLALPPRTEKSVVRVTTEDELREAIHNFKSSPMPIQSDIRIRFCTTCAGGDLRIKRIMPPSESYSIPPDPRKEIVTVAKFVKTNATVYDAMKGLRGLVNGCTVNITPTQCNGTCGTCSFNPSVTTGALRMETSADYMLMPPFINTAHQTNQTIQCLTNRINEQRNTATPET
jgi:hypothetical protein